MKTNELNGLLTVLLTLILGWGCSGTKGESTKTEEIIPVKIIQVQQTNASEIKDYVGTVEESSASSLSFKVLGSVKQVLVNEGQRVHKGQLLATLDKTTLQSAYEATAAILRQAEDACKRLTQLHDNNSLPEIKFVEMQTNLDKARSAERIARENLENVNLFAPYNGVIGSRSLELGMNVLPSQSVMTLLNIDQLKVKVAVPENEIASIHTGLKARITVGALDNRTFEGEIDQKGIVANVLSHTYDVKIKINDKQPQLMPGMICKVLLCIAKGRSTGVVLPNQAIQIGANGLKYVWLNKNNRAEQHIIETGELSDYGVLVTTGLNIGDQVIVDGWQKISNGSKITAL